MTTTSRPSFLASSSASMLVVPQSTVTSSEHARGEHAHGLDVRPVAFEEPVGNVEDRVEPAGAQHAHQERRRGGAVDVVIAEDRDVLLALDGVGEARGRRRHVGERVGVRHQAFHGRIEIGFGVVGRRRRARRARGPSSSGKPRRCVSASAVWLARASSRSRQTRPEAERSTPRKGRFEIHGQRSASYPASLSAREFSTAAQPLRKPCGTE